MRQGKGSQGGDVQAMKISKSALIILGILLVFLLIFQFRYPLALNMDGGYNSANTSALMRFQPMPFSGSPIVPFSLSALFGWIGGFNANNGIKIVTALSLVAVGLLIYLFLKKTTKDELASLAGLVGWCVSFAIITYPMGYLKQTIALPFMLIALISLYFLIETGQKKWWIWLAVGTAVTFLSHQPAAITLAACFAFTLASMLPGSNVRHGKIMGFALWGVIVLGLATSPLTVPILSRYFIQLDAHGYKTILIYLKGLISYRFQMTVDFGGFDWLLAAIPVFGLGRTIEKHRRLALWLLGFGLGVFVVACFASKYEWQGRNIMTLFVPLSILTGLGFYYISDLISKKDALKIAISVSLALLVMLAAGYHVSATKYISATKPVITTSQRESLASIINSLKQEQIDNLYARHGLRFWATEATGRYVGVMFYDWDRKTFGIRKSRGGEDITGSRDPKPGDCLLISKQPMFGAKYETIEFDGVEFKIQKNAQEYFEVLSGSKANAHITFSISTSSDNDKSENVIVWETEIGANKIDKFGFVFGSNFKRGRKDLTIKVVYDDKTEKEHKTSFVIDENLLEYSNLEFDDFKNIVAENEDYIIITPK